MLSTGNSRSLHLFWTCEVRSGLPGPRPDLPQFPIATSEYSYTHSDKLPCFGVALGSSANLQSYTTSVLHSIMSAHKWKASYDSGRKYNKSWEEKYVWVCKASDGSENAFCKLCKTQLAPKASRLADHEKSKGHSNRVSASSKCRALPVNFMPKKCDKEKKRVELEFAVAISCHCSVVSVDHLSEMVKKKW